VVQVKVRGAYRPHGTSRSCWDGVGYRSVFGRHKCNRDDIRALRACGLDGVIVREGIGLCGLARWAMQRGVLGLRVEVYGHVRGRIDADDVVWLRRGLWRCWLLGGVWAVEDGLCARGDIWLDLESGTCAETKPATVPEEGADGEGKEDERADDRTG